MSYTQIHVTNTGVGVITLNREKSLHSLSFEMIQSIYDILLDWEVNESVRFVLLEGTGSKAFCAGGDIKEIYSYGATSVGLEKSKRFFDVEYTMDAIIANYSKPIIALMDGLVMGGGVGLSYGATYRVVTEKTKWAMPETAIGFFPDVGAGYFLNQTPHSIGMYLGLSGAVISGADAIHIGTADFFVPSSSITELRERLVTKTGSSEKDIDQQVKECIESFSTNPPKSELMQQALFIEKHFSLPSVKEIVGSLKRDRSQEAQALYQSFLRKSPVSLLVTYAHLRHTEKLKTYTEALDFDKKVAMQFMMCTDFYEGVRCLLIDKEAQPDYLYQTIEEVPADYVKAFIQ
ncbi:enoyl-CoA hydratase/isomerase family protein [Alkalicoccobacillus murimartini]|uniref:3-hydroxyisobutyryl-CoA hydrolase n=1 Tax=Alkalicoccobacillus murimartini TaxID=171685 RepID=A0ABT9YHC0_9BACI|nr:enoyl-CoA hydratase/isomerase family protein [Alkalicoccobacillus murimartini]MDQ0207261.1 enoyl-CoA hydratase/carnithine racemase [Alkalicoccobacillus murimartini]